MTQSVAAVQLVAAQFACGACPCLPLLTVPRLALTCKYQKLAYITHTVLEASSLCLWCLPLQLTVRVTWDSGDVDQFVREAIEMWDDNK